MNINIQSIEVVKKYVEIVLDIETDKNLKVETLLNDFDEANNGEIISKTSRNFICCYKFRYELTERFEQFHDGILKVIIQGTNNERVLYFTIYSLNMWERYTDDIKKVESYFNDINNDIDIIPIENEDTLLDGNFDKETDETDFDYEENQVDTIEQDSPNYLYETNSYSFSWLSIQLSQWSLDYTSNNNQLFAEFILSYEEEHANILDDVKFYITTLRGAVIYSDGYLTRDGKLPDRIDIWMDEKKHELFIGPVFPIKKEDEIIEEGIRLTMCFKDIKQGYYVRKTYVMENDLWYHEELYAVPLTKF